VKVAVVGVGAVGGALATFLMSGIRDMDVALYDEPRGMGKREDVNAAQVAFVCVPTPAAPDGACDTSIVEEVVRWIESDLIIIRSTVAIGTTRRLQESTGKRIVFQPEYGPAETPDHPFNDLRQVRWVIVGGRRDDTRLALDLWKDVYNSDIRTFQTDFETAELCKYMENTFLAMKVTFCNEMFDIARLFGVDYDELRELWLADNRIGRSHTWVNSTSRGYGGRCLPKDLAALVRAAEERGYDAGLLRAVRATNEKVRAQTLDHVEPTRVQVAALSKTGSGPS